MKDCTRKHLSQALILLEEFDTGDYPVHFWLAVGHMAEAESECRKIFPSLANKIRENRVRMMEEDGFYPDICELIEVAGMLWEMHLKENSETKQGETVDFENSDIE